MLTEEQARELAIYVPELSRDMLNELCCGRQYEEYRAKVIERERQIAQWELYQQQKIHEENKRHPKKFVDGMGQHRFCIHPKLKLRLERLFGKDFLKDKSLVRDNPQWAVPVPEKKTVVVNGFKR